MQHIRNNGRYDFSFKVIEGSKEKKIIFPRRRIYMDTGNIAVAGITAIEDSVLKELKNIKQFKDMLEKGTFEVVDPSEFVKKEDDKDREIAELRAKLAESDTSEMQEALKAKDDEIASLKAKLEAKAPKGKTASNAGAEKPSDAEADTEGF